MSTEDGEDPPVAAPEPSDRVSDPSDAFQALGNEVRMGILETMLEWTDGAVESDRATPSFSMLFEASAVDTSAGFAYHLDELVGPYLRKVNDASTADADADPGADGYELTYAGEQIARAIATGTYTQRVDHPPVPLEDDCPFCEHDSLTARASDNRVTVACGHCERRLLRLDLPPAGLESHGESFPTAFDRYHRHRLSLVRDGVCPACSGEVDARLVRPSPATDDLLPAEHATHLQAEFTCSCCGTTLRSPVALSLLSHPAVVSFYYEHGQAVSERPLWNIGHEWAETVLSEDPLAVRVVVELEDDVLALYVDERLTVVETQRASVSETTEGNESAEGDGAAETTETTEADERGGTHGTGETAETTAQ
ncbi:HTH domain protein [Natrialba magadii ATCC 43099]|uniref:ArsR family transcriptional regulator n=1 Tax=Natrialba magadii (strain ATCC 43099 / DSM 3394 / CCM 3739 / CIP 104546 / IAM 13178 / JCM 8861 / NBRC 102185 / NCIMB 2190 / MS3) TaxID=547559 RepID=D3SYJ2_NATMM|nr:hypothetical protein [Natrialba magadii]ADD04103.1 HTH domain protein [Natrialba magadii ATCC 43099]ELY33260.1 ArsR family transcriptional regulator [Natrialba magadii ATCC 43099]